MQQKIILGIGARIDVEVCKNVEDSNFVSKYVEYHNKKLLERSENEKKYYYDPKEDKSPDIEQKIRKYIIWNMQSVRNRMTLACMDSDQAKKQLKECLWKEKKSSEIGKFLYNSDSYDSTSKVKEKLLGQFGQENGEAINKVLKGFDYKGSIVDSGAFAVEHGIINNVISCVMHELDKDKLEDRLSELNNQRFSNIGPFREKVKKAIAELDNQGAHEKIGEYVEGLNISNSQYKENIESAMKAVWKVLKESDDKRLNELLDNHNLSKEIHRMMPPNLGSMFPSDLTGAPSSYKDILDILENNKSAFFRYLKEHYEINGALAEIEKECDTLYSEYKKAKNDADEYKRKELEPAKEKFKEAERKHTACQERIEELKKGIEKAKGADRNKIDEMKKELREAEGKQPVLQENEETARANYIACQTKYNGKEIMAIDKGQDLITAFRKIEAEFKSKEKYPLRELREICEELSVYEANGKDKCIGDKLSKVGLVGYYFNWERKSGYNNQVLHNVLMRETVEDNIENKKQCVGRGGRKKGPIISLSYVDSAKVNNPGTVKDQLIKGDPFDSLKEVKHKIDTKKYAERMVKGIEEVVNSKYPKKEIEGTKEETKFINEEAYDALIKGTFECILGVRKEIYDRSGYTNGRDEANKCFYQVLKSATSTLKKQLDQKGIVVGDCEIELGIKILESKIGELLEKHKNSSDEIIRKQEEKDKVSKKLKIEGNFLKVIIIKFCTLVLRLWHWRFTLNQLQVEEVLKKEDKLTFKERVGLVRKEKEIKQEESALQKIQDRQKSEMKDFKKEKIDLQKQYNEMHQFIEIKAIKGNVKQKEITEGYKESTKTEQLQYIASELKEVQNRLHKNENDVAVFNELNSGTTGIIELEDNMNSLRKELEEIVHKHQQLAKIKKTLVDLRKSIIGGFSADDQNLLKDRMKQITESLHSGKLMNSTDKDEIKSQINDLYAAGKSEEQNNKLAQDIFEQLLNYMEKASKTSVCPKDTKGGRTKFEKLYNTINHKIDGLKDTDLADKGLQCKLGDAQSLLTYFDNFADEKTRLEKIKEEQEKLQEEAGQLETEKEMLKTNDKKQMDICRRLKVFESINKNYDVRRVVWLGAVLPDFLTKLQGEDDLDLKVKYLSSPIFLELFTNIVAPLANEGNLKIALDIFDKSGKSSKDGAEKICEFYQSLLSKDSDNIKKKINEDFDNVLVNTAQLCVLIVLTKLNHHANALSKDLDLISPLTFGSRDPIGLLKENFANNNTSDTTNNKQKNILQDIAERFFSRNSTTKKAFNDLKKYNPMSTGIRGKHFNTGTTLFTTLNVIMRGLAVAADYKAHDGNDQNSTLNKALGFLGDSSIRRAKEEIARLGKDVHKEVAEKCIYEYLEMLRAGLNGRNYSPPQEPGDLPETSLNTCHVQKLSEDYKKASKGSLPASLIASPDAEKLDRVQAWVKFGG